MQYLKFIILGITGDLSRKKILPALGQFSYLYRNKVDVELIGYSRSPINTDDVIELLNSKAISQIKEVRTITGSYQDPAFFKSLFTSDKEERTIIYFAIPPHVFHELVELLCPYRKKNFDVIVEKPFGDGLAAAHSIIKQIQQCGLNRNVHFCDHYMFKKGLSIENHILLSAVKNKEQIDSIEIKAIEMVDVRGRAGYYQDTGAIKDMVPAHFYSLTKRLFSLLGDTINIDSAEIQNIKLGQYRDFLEDVGVSKSSTETYFHIQLQLNGLPLTFESGKKLERKETSITIKLKDGSTAKWVIDPDPRITIKGQDIKIETHGILDHTNLFTDLLQSSYSKFLTDNDVILGWRLYEKIKEFIDLNRVHVEIY